MHVRHTYGIFICPNWGYLPRSRLIGLANSYNGSDCIDNPVQTNYQLFNYKFFDASTH